MQTGVWENLYQSVKKPPLDPVLTGFNANIDRVIPVTPSLMRSFEEHAVEGFDTILPRLKRSMHTCSADEAVISDPSFYAALSGSFSSSGTLSIGGQAGIAAVHLRRLGVPSVTCAVPGAGEKTCALLEDAGIIPLAFEPAAGAADSTHLVFEYPPGLVPLADHVVPRSNRFIVSPLHDPSTAIIPEKAERSFLGRIAPCRRAFLSGYQYLRTEQEFKTAARQIRLIRSVHPRMRTHVECVSGADRDVMAMMVRHIFTSTDSIGLNERELGLFMRVIQEPGPATERAPSSPETLLCDLIALADATGAPRIHLHTFGYYMVILKSGNLDTASSQNALLLASRVTAGTAGKEHTLSREGLKAYTAVRNMSGADEKPGIFCYNGHTVVFVPTYIAHDICRTTGLGDILSSTAFIADPF